MRKLFVIFTAVALVAAFAATSTAAEWKFYGSARVSGWSIDRDDGAGRSERNTRFQMQNNTRFGARVSADKLYGRVEFGLNPDGDTNDSFLNSANNAGSQNIGAGVYTRLMYGVWDFGAGKMLVGQDYTDEFLSISNANNATGSDSVMIGRGVAYGGRRAQVRFEFGGFHIALVDDTAVDRLTAVDQNGAAALTEVTIPKVVASYAFKLDPVSLDVVGSYLSYDIDRGTLTDLSVDGYFIGGRAGVKLGPALFRGTLWWAQNMAQLGLTTSGAGGAAVVGIGNTARIVDNDTLGYCLTALYRVNDMLAFEAGYGEVEHEQDDAGLGNNLPGAPANSGALTEDDRAAYYVQAVIKLAPGVFIIPEIGRDDFKQNNQGVDQGDATYFGAKFQIDF